MSARERVGIAEFRVAAAPEILVCYGLGSCLGIALFHEERRLGGLAHTLLPAARPGLGEDRPSKFVDGALRLMLEELSRRGAERAQLVAKIVGGANMFGAGGASLGGSIGQRNIKAAQALLQDFAIPIVAEDVGGHCGRTVEFDLSTGRLQVRSVRDNAQVFL